ncbi:MAG: hypothetical protein ABUL54_00840, partial [Dongia sp.]
MMSALPPSDRPGARAEARRKPPLVLWVRLAITAVLAVLWLLFGAVKVYVHGKAEVNAQNTLTALAQSYGQYAQAVAALGPPVAQLAEPTPSPDPELATARKLMANFSNLVAAPPGVVLGLHRIADLDPAIREAARNHDPLTFYRGDGDVFAAYLVCVKAGFASIAQ